MYVYIIPPKEKSCFKIENLRGYDADAQIVNH